MPSTVSTVLLSSKGEARKAQLTLSAEKELSLDVLQKYMKRKEQPEAVANYTYRDRTLTIFGYKKGKKGTESKIQLPFPHTDTLYGDALVVTHLGEWTQPLPYTVDQWETFYQQMADGDEKDDDDEEDEEKDEEKDDEDKEKEEEEEEEEVDEEKEDEDMVEFDEEPEPEPEPEPVRRRRVTAPGRAAAEAAALKPEITREEAAADQPLRVLCLRSLDFLAPLFPESEIQALERAIFEVTFDTAQKTYLPLNWKSPLFCEAYRQNLRTVLSNLHPQSPVNNPRLLRRIQDGEFPLSALPSMTPYEMYPENWFMLKDKLVQREQKILEGNKSRATDQFRCRRCQKRECTYYELQTRSADEPMTIFITCLNCGKEWRQGG
jgi:hypothetical protein